MARTPKFAFKQTPRGWLVNSPATITQSGRRERSYFPTRDAAKAHAAALREKFLEHGGNAQVIPPSLAEAATSAQRLLEPLGISLLDAVTRFVEMETRNRASATIEDATAAFQLVKEGSSDKQTSAYRLRCEKLVAEFSGRMLSTIRGEELQSHLEETTSGPAGFNQNYRLVRAIWKWSSKPPRSWCTDEPIRHLETKDAISGEIGILTAAEAKAVLQAAENHFPEAVIPFAIALFTGLRAAEICRLDPKDITADGINLPAANDRKNKRRRFIQMPDPLAAWLKAYPITDNVVPPDWYRKHRAVRRLAGFRVWSDLVAPPAPPEDLPEWPSNALRHTAATVAVALGKPLEKLVFEHGHSGGLKTLQGNYVGAMPRSEAIKIWTIGPNGKKLPYLKVA